MVKFNVLRFLRIGVVTGFGLMLSKMGFSITTPEFWITMALFFTYRFLWSLEA